MDSNLENVSDVNYIKNVNHIQTTKVSTHKVRAINIPDDPNKGNVKASDWFPVAYPNIWICASKNSGKTTAISNIIWRCKGNGTRFLFIVSTFNKDPIWIKLIENLEGDDYEVSTYHDMVDDDGINVLEELYSTLKDEQEKKDEDEKKPVIVSIPKQRVIMAPVLKGKSDADKINMTHNVEKKPKKPKLITPDWIIVSDDQGKDNRNKFVAQLLKKNRHWKIMYITSTQDAKDISPDAIRQMDYTLLFPGISDERLKDIWENLKPNIDFIEFNTLYKDATSKKYSFLYISKDNEYRKGFTEQYTI